MDEQRDWLGQPITFADTDYSKGPAGMITGSGFSAPSPKPWAEIGLEQKVERLRDEVATLRVRSKWWLSEVQRLQETIERLTQHSHDALGHVVVPFRAQYGAGVGPKAESSFDPLA